MREVSQKPADLTGGRHGNASLRSHRAFSNLFSTYKEVVDRAYQGSGSLFEKLYKCKPVTNDRYFDILVAFIHLAKYYDAQLKASSGKLILARAAMPGKEQLDLAENTQDVLGEENIFPALRILLSLS